MKSFAKQPARILTRPEGLTLDVEEGDASRDALEQAPGVEDDQGVGRAGAPQRIEEPVPIVHRCEDVIEEGRDGGPPAGDGAFGSCEEGFRYVVVGVRRKGVRRNSLRPT